MSSLRHLVGPFAEATFSTDDGAPPAARVAWLCSELDDFVTRAGARGRFVVALSVWVVKWLVPLLVFRALPFGALSRATRIRALERAETSMLGPAVLGLKTLVCLIWFEHPDSAHEIRFDGGCKKAPS